MAKKKENKRKPPSSNLILKTDKLKTETQERLIEKAKLREDQALQEQKNEELLKQEHQVTCKQK